MSKLLYYEDLKDKKCDCPECQKGAQTGHPLIFTQLCHPDAGLDVVYFEGQVAMKCHQCGKHVGAIAVGIKNTDDLLRGNVALLNTLRKANETLILAGLQPLPATDAKAPRLGGEA